MGYSPSRGSPTRITPRNESYAIRTEVSTRKVLGALLDSDIPALDATGEHGAELRGVAFSCIAIGMRPGVNNLRWYPAAPDIENNSHDRD